MVRCSVRMRRRDTDPKSVRIPTEVPEHKVAKSLPTVSTRPCDGLSSASPSPTLPNSQSVHTFELDTDTETEVGVEAGVPTSTAAAANIEELDGARTPTKKRQSCTDFSRYLGGAFGPGSADDDVSVTVVDSDSFSRVTSMEDAYGWEAELDKKLKCGVASPPHCPYQYTRRALAGRHNLLHRVFSMHSTRRVNSP